MIVALIVCLTVLIIGYRVEPYVDRLIRLKESGGRDSATSPIRRPTLPSPVVVPDDLVAVAMMESEEWAQSDAIAVIREKYEKLKDWQAVRRAVGIGELP